jgi:UNC-50 family
MTETSPGAANRRSRLAVPSGEDSSSSAATAAAAAHNETQPLVNNSASSTSGGPSGASYPVRSSGSNFANSSSSTPAMVTTNPSIILSQYVSRMSDVRQMDIQSALDQMRTIVSFRPMAVYKTAYYRKQTKNHWYRDDPAFCVVLVTFLGVSAIAYSVAFRMSIIGTISFFLYSILWNFLGCGIILATICREIANRHLSSNSNLSTHVKQQVEWFYSFDIHCNAFFTIFVLLCKCHRFNVPLTILPFGNLISRCRFTFCRRSSVFPATRSLGRKLCRVNTVKYLVRSCDIVVLVHYTLGIPDVALFKKD